MAGNFQKLELAAQFAYSANHYSQGPVVSIFSIPIVLLTFPVVVVVLVGGRLLLRGHGEGPNEIHHLPIHCVIHLATAPAAIPIVACLNWVCRTSSDPPPNWLKLLIWGYLCFYAVLLQVALFPIEVYIP